MVAPLIIAAMPVISEVIDRLFPDSEKRELARLEIEAKLIETAASLDVGQMEVNKVEAASPNLFVAGARPFIMWVCGFGFAYHVIFQPFITYVCALYGKIVPLPVFDSNLLETTMYGLLGLGALRTVDKVKGVATEGIVSNLPWIKK